MLAWLVRGLLCRSEHEPGGRAVLVTGCDTGIGEVIRSSGHEVMRLQGHEVMRLQGHEVMRSSGHEVMVCPGHEVARHLDSLGCIVFAGCLNTASEVST